jgi:hypothetical protein
MNSRLDKAKSANMNGLADLNGFSGITINVNQGAEAH